MKADSRTSSSFVAVALLCIMGILMFFSVREDSATMDEILHVTAGYSYLTEKDYRLNREHPPLSKDIAAIPLLFFVRPKFPTNIPAWRDFVNDQWPIARAFFYQSGNNPDRILFAARLPFIALTLLLGWLFFIWVRRMFGGHTAMLALFFFAFSPTIIAHGRYATTDIAITFGFFIAIISFMRFFQQMEWKSALVAGFALGIALLIKVSALALIPLYALYATLWILLHREYARKVILFSFIIAGVAVILVWAVYGFHIQNYPADRQIRDTKLILSQFRFPAFVDLTVAMTHHSLIRPFALYLLATLMALHNFSIQGPAFFLGEVSISGWWHYFPVAFLLKEPLPFLLLMILAFVSVCLKLRRTRLNSKQRLISWTRSHFTILSIVLFLIFYWLLAIRTLLSIGIRHMLPTYPFLYTLVALSMTQAVSGSSRFPRRIILFAALAWLAFGTIAAFPYYLSYYNELAGGTSNGYRYIVDSNYDWGQDLKRLARFVEENHIEKIGLDYFGGGSPEYYLGSRFVPWSAASGKPDVFNGDPEWIGVSINTLQNAQGRPIGYWSIEPKDTYSWLRGVSPVARAGTSIFIYRFGKAEKKSP